MSSPNLSQRLTSSWRRQLHDWRYASEYENSWQTVQTESAGGFTAEVKTGNDLVGTIDDLALCVDLQAGECVIEDRR
jgi:hypothetical protein